MLTIVPRLHSLQTIQCTSVIPRGHLDAQGGGHKQKIERPQILPPIPWLPVVIVNMGLLDLASERGRLGDSNHVEELMMLARLLSIVS